MLREDIILKIEELKKETKTYQKLLQIWDKSGLAERTGAAMRFFNARPQTAINVLLREKGPQTQGQLTAELQAGGIAVGKKRGMHNTRISIEKTLKTGALKQVGNLIGLPEWSDEKFNE
jgi:hypothetical protein